MQWPEYFRDRLLQLDREKLRRHRSWHVDCAPLIMRRADGTELINFGTNDYLGLRQDVRLQEAVARQCCGTGAGASPLVSGYNSLLCELERRLARWQSAEAALVFSSGYALNVGLVSGLTGPDDLVLSDQLNHASLIDGCRLSRAARRIFSHNDVEQVAAILKAERHRYQRAILLCEAIYSMDGDAAPLVELSDLCQRYDTGLVVDEAHASGLYGPAGAGLGAELKLSQRWLAKIGTLGKAMGTSGGFVTGSRDLIDYLVNCCRSYVYSTAIAPPVVAATLAALELMPELEDRRQRLRELSRRVREQLRGHFEVIHGESPIVPIIVGTSAEALAWQQRLQLAGYYVPAIRPPTVPTGRARLRLSLSALHTDQQLDQLLEELTCPTR